ncbi:PREDICTED: CREB-regulated transcription coactivator 3 isoform X1 [Nanorana parkeri]|uniref:CREB-regulated transcription coactivator 3 isoform X1 n=1 Tax=Nanorana parkeri TaxID=125878 RepID=UPI000854EA68|nr:PREDICTED: CREB-regulated transcription coactivator 3 isoform X1 [Nanorana parkeri]
MASQASSGTNPRKFSEKIALHNQKQAEETRAFDELMTDLTMSRVQFQKLQQLRMAQSRAQYYGGSLPNVNQISSCPSDFQGSFHHTDNIRGMRHHGLVERVSRNRLHPPHHRPVEKHGRQCDSSPYASVYLSPPPDNSWRRQQAPWSEEKRPGFRLLSALNRTNSDSALHTSASSTKTQGPYVGGNQPVARVHRPTQHNTSLQDGEMNSFGEAFSYPSALAEENMLNISKPLPKQLWEAREVQSMASRPRSCEVPGIKVYPSSDQNLGLSHFQGNLNTGGSLPDLTNLHFPPPLPTPLDPDDTAYAGMGTENSTGGLPAAMTHLGISNSPGLQNTRSNPQIQATLNNTSLASSVNNHGPPSGRSNASLHQSLRLASLSNPSLPTAALGSSPRRKHTPVSPLTLTPGGDQSRCMSGQFSPTSPMSMASSQGIAMDRSPLSLPPLEPPPPYPLYQDQSQHSLQQVHDPHESQNLQPPSPVPCPPLDLNLANNSLSGFFSDSFFDQQQPTRQGKYLWHQQEQYDMYESPSSSLPNTNFFDPNMNLQYSQAAMMGLGGSHGNLQDPFQQRTNYLYSTYGGSVPNIILTDDTSNSLSKDIGSAVAGVSELGFDTDNTFQLDDELRLGPLSLDGLNMLSDPDMVLPDPSIEDSFRSDRL